jgi:hypothetical protein
VNGTALDELPSGCMFWLNSCVEKWGRWGPPTSPSPTPRPRRARRQALPTLVWSIASLSSGSFGGLSWVSERPSRLVARRGRVQSPQ